MAGRLPQLEDFNQHEDPIPQNKKPAKLPTLDSLSVKQDEGLAGQVQPYKYNDYGFQPKLGQNNDKLRAQDQSFGEQAGLFLANLIPNIAGSLVENLGYLGTMATQWGDQRTYSNWLTQAGQDMRNPFGQIWRENPDRVWDVADPAWWFQNAESLAESATAFAGIGWGVGKLFSGLTGLLRFGSTARGLIKGGELISELGTASTLAYTEAAQFGGTTYKTVYDEQYKQLRDNGVNSGDAEIKAKHLASQAAAAAVQLNTLFATALNLPAIAPLFRSNDEILAGLSKNFKRQAGETFDGWKQRLTSMGAADRDIAKLIDVRKNFLYSYAGTALSEGSEEVINQWAEQRGLDRGKKGKELNGIEDLLGDVSSFFDDTMNASGALSFVMGGFGGVAQTALIDHIPYHKVYVNDQGENTLRAMDAELTSDGKYKTKFVTSQNREKVGNKALFENSKQAVVNDLKRIDDINTKLKTAIEKGDEVEADRLRFQLFDSGAINSIALGTADSFASQFTDIAALDNSKSLHEKLLPQVQQLTEAVATEEDPEKKQVLQTQLQQLNQQVLSLTGVTEAMQKGFAKDNKDNKYKEQANQAAVDVRDYAKLWDTLQEKHGHGDEFHSRYAEYLFGKIVDTKRRGRILDHYESQVREDEAHRDSLLGPTEDPVAVRTISDALVDNATRESLVQDVKDLHEALTSKDKEKISDLAERYLPNTDATDDLSETVPGIVKQINEHIAAIDKRFNDNMASVEASEQYQAWKEKNPKKNVIEYLRTTHKKGSLTEDINKHREYIAKHREALTINNENLAKLQSSKGKAEYIRQAKATHNKLAQALKAKIDVDNKNFIDQTLDSKAMENLDNVQKQQYIQSLTNEKQLLEEELARLQGEVNKLQEIRTKISEAGLIKRTLQGHSMRANEAAINERLKKIDELRQKISDIDARIADLTTRPGATPQEAKNVPNEPVPPSEPATTISAGPLLDLINSSTKTEMQAAGIVEALNNYERELRAGVAHFTLNFLDQAGYVGKGKLTQAAAAAIMLEFKDHFEGVKKEEKKPVTQQVDPVQAQIAAINDKRNEDLVALQKGKKGVVAARKAINDAADLAISQLLMPDQAPETPKKSAAEFTTEDIPSEDEPFTDIVQPPLDYEQGVMHEGLKVEEAAAKVNTLTHEYEQDITKDELGNVSYVMKDLFSLNDAVNPLYLQHGGIKEGDEINLVVDSDYDSNVNDKTFIYGPPKQKPDKFKNYVNKDGSINLDLVAELPIKITITKGGKTSTIGYLPTSSWITQKYSSTADDFRNVVDVKHNSDGTIKYQDNVEAQRIKNLELRTKLATAYNYGRKEGLAGQVQSRSEGIILRVPPATTNTLLTDKSLQLAVANAGTVKIEKEQTLDGAVVDPRWNNALGIMLPAPNGNMVFEPLVPNRISKADVDTVLRAIEIYLILAGDTQVSEDIRDQAIKDNRKIWDTTGLGVNDVEHLRSFINQFYYYTQNFNDARVRADQDVLKGEKKTPKFMLSISKSPGAGYHGAYIKAGVSFLNRLAKAEIDSEGNLNEDFKDLLHDQNVGLASRFRNTVFSKPEFGIRGINSLGAINEMTYQPKSGTWRVTKHESYNAMVKANSITTAYGKLKLPSGEHVYFAHPNTQLNYQAIMDTDIGVVAQPQEQSHAAEFSKPVVDEAKSAEQFSEAQKEALRNLTTNMDDNFGLQKIHISVQSAGNVPGKALTIDNLQEMLNFTPAENRNGKTPIEVFEELSRLGLDTIPKSENPFYSCK